MRIALVHDHLIQIGGGERVLQVLHRMFPEAPIFTLFYNKDLAHYFPNADIRPSFLQRIPGALQHYQWFLPLMPLATESYDLREFDVVISSVSAFAKGIITRPDTVHICYCHTPTRYLWMESQSYVSDLKKPAFVKPFLPMLLSRLRQWDHAAAERVDVFIANSKSVQQRINKYYRKPSTVVYPPVPVAGIAPATGPGEFFLTGGRLVPYKRFDITIQAFNRLGWPLTIFGTGPILSELRNMARPNITFLGFVSDAERSELYKRSIAFIHPQEEDFGLTAVESMAAGRPVVALRRGGAVETVAPGISGTFFDTPSWESLYDTMSNTDFAQFNPDTVHAHALMFDESLFVQAMQQAVNDAYASRS
ncbi:MAG: glycosyltransferase [bacterium]|nr:glycosyltransferase [bacterium]